MSRNRRSLRTETGSRSSALLDALTRCQRGRASARRPRERLPAPRENLGVGQEKGCDGKTVAFQGIMERGTYALMRDLARATEFERFNANGELVRAIRG